LRRLPECRAAYVHSSLDEAGRRSRSQRRASRRRCPDRFARAADRSSRPREQNDTRGLSMLGEAGEQNPLGLAIQAIRGGLPFPLIERACFHARLPSTNQLTLTVDVEALLGDSCGVNRNCRSVTLRIEATWRVTESESQPT